MIHYVPLPSPQAVYWIIQSCFDELMKKGAMRRLKLHDWPTAMRLCRQSERDAPSNPETEMDKGGKVKLNKEERSERLATGMMKLARRCHVSSTLSSSVL